MPCSQCKKVVADSDRINCRGYCRGEFHVFCAKVDSPLMEQLGIHGRNVYWMCDGCADMFENEHFRCVADKYNGAQNDAIQAMQADIAKLNETVAALVAKVPDTPTWPNQERKKLEAKRKLEPSSKPELPPPSQGTKVLSVPVPAIGNGLPDDKFWIWLAGFLPNSTEEVVCTTVRDILSCEEGDAIVAKALVKKGVDISSLRSVTFKVGVDEKYREAAMDPGKWPRGISFREFVDLGRSAESGFPKQPRLNSPTATA